jgi:glycosyltransferase involved in cell wall biosynthesis
MKKLSIIIPVYDEEKTILDIIDKIKKVNLKNIKKEIVIVDDFSTDNPREYTKLLKPIIEDNKKVVYGTRLEYIKHNVKNMNRLHFIGNVFLTHTTNLLYNTKITDMETGYKVFKKEVIEKIRFKAKRFDFEPEITAKILKQGYKIYEVPITFKARKFNEGKKITWRDGIKALFYLIKYRFTD